MLPHPSYLYDYVVNHVSTVAAHRDWVLLRWNNWSALVGSCQRFLKCAQVNSG